MMPKENLLASLNLLEKREALFSVVDFERKPRSRSRAVSAANEPLSANAIPVLLEAS
jgi:hypothetical protein